MPYVFELIELGTYHISSRNCRDMNKIQIYMIEGDLTGPATSKPKSFDLSFFRTSTHQKINPCTQAVIPVGRCVTIKRDAEGGRSHSSCMKRGRCFSSDFRGEDEDGWSRYTHSSTLPA
jgi:hypothetical protein